MTRLSIEEDYCDRCGKLSSDLWLADESTKDYAVWICGNCKDEEQREKERKEKVFIFR